MACHKKTKKKTGANSGKGIRRYHRRRRIGMKFRVVGGLQEIVLRFKFHQNRISGFGAVGGSKFALPIDLGISLYISLYYCTSRDKETCELGPRLIQCGLGRGLLQ